METKLSKSQRDKLRLQKLKEQNPDEWRRRQDLRNEKRKLAREKSKLQNPEEYREMLDLRSTI